MFVYMSKKTYIISVLTESITGWYQYIPQVGRDKHALHVEYDECSVPNKQECP
jgi:hypothetical protein